jgi:hypothetical protein
LERARERVGIVVDGHARGLQHDVGVEPAFQKEPSRLVMTACNGREKVRRGWLLTTLLRQTLRHTA